MVFDLFAGARLPDHASPVAESESHDENRDKPFDALAYRQMALEKLEKPARILRGRPVGFVFCFYTQRLSLRAAIC